MPVVEYLPPASFVVSSDSCVTPGWWTPSLTDLGGVDVDVTGVDVSRLRRLKYRVCYVCARAHTHTHTRARARTHTFILTHSFTRTFSNLIFVIVNDNDNYNVFRTCFWGHQSNIPPIVEPNPIVTTNLPPHNSCHPCC